MLKTVFFGLGTIAAGAAFIVGWGAISACENLDKTSPLLDIDAMSIYDAGYIPPAAPDDSEDPGTTVPDDGPKPNTLRVRLANLTQGGDPLELCAAQGTGAFAVATDVTGAGTSIKSVAAGTISAPVLLGPITSAATGKFSFRVGSPDCTTASGSLASLAPSTTFKGGSSITLIVAGDPAAADTTDPLYPQLKSVNDLVAPPANATAFRAAHGAVGLPPFDVVVNNETVLTGIRFNTAVGYPYSSTSGYASIASGIPQASTITLRSGTTIRNFTVPERVRRGIADTMIVTGTLNNVSASICSDRAPTSGNTTADCTPLNPAPGN